MESSPAPCPLFPLVCIHRLLLPDEESHHTSYEASSQAIPFFPVPIFLNWEVMKSLSKHDVLYRTWIVKYQIPVRSTNIPEQDLPLLRGL